VRLEELRKDIAPARGADFVPLLKSPNAAVRLICFHFAGGSAQSFLSWRQPSSDVCELIAAELPGRSRRYNENFTPSILHAAERFADACQQMETKRCVFYGHSLGALLAYETARVLARRGTRGPERLVVSSRSAPGSFPASTGLPELSNDALLKYLHDLQGTKQSILENKMLMDMMLPIIRADLEIIYKYRHRSHPLLDIPLDVIGAIDDRHCPFELLLAWRNVTRNTFQLHMIPGGHFAPIAHPGIVLQIINQLKTH
jgi:medium-chain acyl-[acyl-carrier-protein] hydrolase